MFGFIHNTFGNIHICKKNPFFCLTPTFNLMQSLKMAWPSFSFFLFSFWLFFFFFCILKKWIFPNVWVYPLLNFTLFGPLSCREVDPNLGYCSPTLTLVILKNSTQKGSRKGVKIKHQFKGINHWKVWKSWNFDFGPSPPPPCGTHGAVLLKVGAPKGLNWYPERNFLKGPKALLLGAYP